MKRSHLIKTIRNDINRLEMEYIAYQTSEFSEDAYIRILVNRLYTLKEILDRIKLLDTLE